MHMTPTQQANAERWGKAAFRNRKACTRWRKHCAASAAAVLIIKSQRYQLSTDYQESPRMFLPWYERAALWLAEKGVAW